MHSSIPASKQHLHLECLSDDGIQLYGVATDDDIDFVWIFIGLLATKMAMALRSAKYVGYDHSLQSGAYFIPSLLFNRLSSEEIFSNEKVDGCVFHWAMDCRRTSLDSGDHPYEMGRTFYVVEHVHYLCESVFRYQKFSGHECPCFSV